MARARTAQSDTAGTTSRRGRADPVGCNEVRLRGKVAAEAEERELPSGDRLTQLRIVVPREPTARPRPRRGAESAPARRTQTIDTIDLVCWTAQTRRAAARLRPGDRVDVTGALRRRFFGGPGGRQSRYEVEVAALRRVAEASSDDT